MIATGKTPCLRRISAAADRICRDAGFGCRIISYDSSAALLRDLERDEPYQILLLDVMMQELGGLELAAKLRALGNRTMIIFISSNREMALQGYEVSAIRFLAKPVDEGKLEEALRYAYTRIQAKKKSCCRQQTVSTGSLFPIFSMWRPLSAEPGS